MGTRPFSDISAAGSLSTLRFFLAQLGVKDAALYRTHDLRRGRAFDLQQRGGTLREILQAGEWSSPAFLSYLDMTQLELGAVVEAHLAESEDEAPAIQASRAALVRSIPSVRITALRRRRTRHPF